MQGATAAIEQAGVSTIILAPGDVVKREGVASLLSQSPLTIHVAKTLDNPAAVCTQATRYTLIVEEGSVTPAEAASDLVALVQQARRPHPSKEDIM